MRNCLFWTLLFALALSPPSTGSTEDKPIKSRTPLSADEIAVYKAVLQQHISGDSGSLNVSVTTYPLDPTSPLNNLSESECLQGIRLENLAEVSHSFHDLTPEVLPAKNVKLVVFATGLFSMSEIAFDKEHRNAVVSYSFRCGPRCGYGATLVLEKVGNQWRKTERKCGDWISSVSTTLQKNYLSHKILRNIPSKETEWRTGRIIRNFLFDLASGTIVHPACLFATL